MYSISPCTGVASSPGPTQILSHSSGENREKAWEQNYVTTGNGGLGYYVMWARFRNDGNMPMHNVAGIGQFNPPQCFCQRLRTSQVPSH